MTQVVKIAEEVAQAVQVVSAEAKEEGEESSQMDLSFPEISKVALEEAKAEEEMGQMIAYVPDPNSKVEKTWDLHEVYHFVRIGCTHGHNLTVKSFHTLKDNSS